MIDFRVGGYPPTNFRRMRIKNVFPFYIALICISAIFYFFNQILVGENLLINKERVLFKSFDIIGITESFLVFCLILPFLEELSFRAVLSKNSNYIRLGFSFFIWFLFFKILEFYYDLNLWIDLGLNIILSLFLNYLLKIKDVEIKFLSKNLIISSVVFSAFFAIFHIGVYYDSNNLFHLLISVFPFFISGLVFCRVRIKFGLFYSILLHSLINFTGWFLSLI